MRRSSNRIEAVSAVALVWLGLVGNAAAHPGSGIVVDRNGEVYFVDTGSGVWKIGRDGKLERHEGPAFHWMALDPRGRFEQRHLPRDTGGELPVVGRDPRLILASDFPVVVSDDGVFYYPQANREGRVQIVQLTPGGRPRVFATLPAAMEVEPDGKRIQARWIHGLAAGPDGSLYYTEQRALRRVDKNGQVSTVAENVEVPDCERPPAVADARLGPCLRGLAVAADGTAYVAASGCSAVVKISPDGRTEVILRATDSWSPTGIACAGGDIYVLEYLHVEADRREDWVPRVRKLTADGRATTIAQLKRQR